MAKGPNVFWTVGVSDAALSGYDAFRATGDTPDEALESLLLQLADRSKNHTETAEALDAMAVLARESR